MRTFFVTSWPMLFNIIQIHSVNFPRIPGLRLTALLGSFLVFRILLCIMAVACKSFSDVSVTSLVIFCFPSRSWMTVLKGSQFPFSVTEAQNCPPQSHLPYLFWHLSFRSSPLPGTCFKSTSPATPPWEFTISFIPTFVAKPSVRWVIERLTSLAGSGDDSGKPPHFSSFRTTDY